MDGQAARQSARNECFHSQFHVICSGHSQSVSSAVKYHESKRVRKEISVNDTGLIVVQANNQDNNIASTLWCGREIVNKHLTDRKLVRSTIKHSLMCR